MKSHDTKRRIVIESLNFNETASIPYHLDFTPPVRKMLSRHFNTDDLDKAVGNYISWMPWRPSLDFNGSRLDRNSIKDEFGVIWSEIPENRGYVRHHPLQKPDLSGYEFPDPYVAGRFTGLKDRIGANRELFILAWAGDFFERAHFLRGLSEILMDMYLNPQFVHDLLDNILEFIMGNIRQLAKFDIDGIFISDDYGNQNSLLMSPKHWRIFIKPRLQKLIKTIKEIGLFAFLHSCGNVSEIIPDLIEIGLDVLHPIQPETMDIFSLKSLYGREISLYGGISTQQKLNCGKPEDVYNEVRKVTALMSKGGGYILAPGITLQHDVPIANILAFLDAAS